MKLFKQKRNETKTPFGEAPRKARGEIRTLVINNHAGLLDQLGRFLLVQPGIDLAGMWDDFEEALEEAEALHPQMIVLGLQTRGMSGLAATRQLRQKFPTSGIVIASANGKRATARLWRNHGADAIILGNRLRQQLLPAMRRVVAQRTPKATTRVLNAPLPENSYA
jgi:DNA-binding NarL/FixJ family response regulator